MHIPAHDEFYDEVTITCDRCGVICRPADANQIIVMLDPDECVSYRHGRDYCAACASVMWEGICEVIGADPDDEGGFDDIAG
jgi:RNase P subunit RPR2